MAARARVSIATVSRVLNGVANKASAETAERVRTAAAALDYRPLSAGRALRKRQSHAVAVLANNLANTAMAAVAASLEIALRDAGLVMLLCDTHGRPELQDEYLLEMRTHLVRATILLGAVKSAQLATLIDADEPLLFVNRRNPMRGRAPFVGIDNRAAAAEVADLLIARELRDAVVVHASTTSSATADRVRGFADRMKSRGTTPSTMTFEGLEHLDIGYRAADAILAGHRLPQAFVCLSDLIAYGVHRRLREAHIDVPGRCMIVGFDDNPLNDWIAPWLTSVRIPYGAFGAAVVESLQRLALGEPPVSRLLPHELVVRS